MNAEQIELRKKAASQFKDAIETVSKIESTGWEIPARYIESQLTRWVEMYGCVSRNA